ncbi:hypothetical protein LRAMOSA02334 [Lichtheimia ramosa]|uniref:Uncharacterized protein n=1 Tax=Lichtheimia ramosa TaxID=688394 RepID=A0A077WKZ3_9FUNG|nr:hypothetical protein LRAMOSA02334 [Lichtheimia ramosa]
MTNWSQLYNEPAVSVKYKHSNSVIAQSSIELQQCVDRQVKLLYERAMALSACAQFQTALRDATAIQELAPLSSLGYYAAGYIYMQYGKQKEAIDVLDQGLTVVSDPIQQQRLQSLQEDATARLSVTIDFISKLPLDIVSSFIIPSTMFVPSKDAFSYLHVCKTWCECAFDSKILVSWEYLPTIIAHATGCPIEPRVKTRLWPSCWEGWNGDFCKDHQLYTQCAKAVCYA